MTQSEVTSQPPFPQTGQPKCRQLPGTLLAHNNTVKVSEKTHALYLCLDLILQKKRLPERTDKQPEAALSNRIPNWKIMHLTEVRTVSIKLIHAFPSILCWKPEK